MFQGNWTCSGCGKAIIELPFEPKGTSGLTCRDCHAKKMAGNNARATDENGQPAVKAKVEGNWQCSGCNAAITSLPFTPRDTSNLLCIDCYKKKKAN